MRGPKVFISYAHSTEDFADNVLKFSDSLRKRNIETILDQYEDIERSDLSNWIEKQVEEADYVIVVCTEEYYDKVKNYDDNDKKHPEIEGIYKYFQKLNISQKFIPIMFNEYKTNSILKQLKSSTCYYVEREKDYNKLYNRLISGTKDLDVVEEKMRKNLFINSSLDNKSWDKSGFSGIMYLFNKEKDKPPVICTLFTDKIKGEKIFRQWKKKAGNEVFEEIDITIIEKKNVGKADGYFFLIKSSEENIVKIAKGKGYNINIMEEEEKPKYQYMAVDIYKNNLLTFKNLLQDNSKYFIAPAYFKNGKVSGDMNNIEVAGDLAILMDKVTIKKFEELTPSDIEYCVVDDPMSK